MNKKILISKHTGVEGELVSYDVGDVEVIVLGEKEEENVIFYYEDLVDMCVDWYPKHPRV